MLDLTYTAPKPKVIAGAKHDWELVIGMEIHAQVASNAKLFSGASTPSGRSRIPTWPSSMPRCRGCCR
jgi:aspartyl-tRNA(Asn)/glutamyl-tRNA(Gln) amidotransferase subunit B